MRGVFALVVLGLALTAATDGVSRTPQPTTIDQHPELAALLRSSNLDTYYIHSCAGTILNNRSVLSSARCVVGDAPNVWRFRVGSTLWNSGGDVYTVSLILLNGFNPSSMTNDIAILRTSTNIVYSNSVQPGHFAGHNYLLADNQVVNTAGWGYVGFLVWYGDQFPELRQVQARSVNLDFCRPPYAGEGYQIQNSMICSGFNDWSNLDSTLIRDKCFGEPGSPLYHSGVVVGVRSFGLYCPTDPSVPSISTRVSSFIDWIVSNA